jgi:long-chain fatty acid transport protein
MRHNFKAGIFASFFLVMLTALVISPPARGSGFALMEQSASTIGQSYAGASAEAEDSSCIFYNPALMTQLDAAPQVSLGGHVIIPDIPFENNGSCYPALGCMPVTGGDGNNGAETAFIPNLYYSQGLKEGLRLGIGIFVPFGLATEYDDGWVGRYHALRTDLKTLNINPSLAWQINKYISIGGGLNAEYVRAKLTSAVDFGSILAGYGVPGAMPQQLDGEAEVKGDDWGFGWNAGLWLQPTDLTKIGLSYRSKVDTCIDGDARFDTPPQAAALQAQNMFVNTDAKADLTLPEMVSLGIAQEILDGLTLMAGISWTHWGRFEELRVKYDSSQPDSVTDESWEDT